MYIALKNDYSDFTPPPNRGGLLTPWADRGVLLLNTCLTVRAHEAKSHGSRGWERLTQRAIDLVAARRPRGVVFMAWGTPAGMCVKKVDTTKHLVLKAVHPSPLSASRGFFTCGHFRTANEWLVKKYGAGSEIDWTLGPKQPTIQAVVGAKAASEPLEKAGEAAKSDKSSGVGAKKAEAFDDEDEITEAEAAAAEMALAEAAKKSEETKVLKKEAQKDEEKDGKGSDKENKENKENEKAVDDE